MKGLDLHHYSRFTDKGPSICERAIGTLRNLLNKPIFLAGNADWLSELPSTIKKFNNTIHSSTKMTLIQASKKANGKKVYNNLKNDREIQQSRYKLGQLFRKADIKRVFSKGDSTNYSYKLYAKAEVKYVTLPSLRINILPERYNHFLQRPTNLNLDEINQVKKELNLIPLKL